MRVLVLGGTSFAGRHVVMAAVGQGHDVTTFNRGRTNPGLVFPGRALRGDRTTGDYDALRGAGPFDAVVDMCAYVPLWNWDRTRPQEPLKAGISREREAELLRRWR